MKYAYGDNTNMYIRYYEKKIKMKDIIKDILEAVTVRQTDVSVHIMWCQIQTHQKLSKSEVLVVIIDFIRYIFTVAI